MRATRADLERALNRLVKNFGRQFYMDWTQRQPRFCLKGRELSPRLSKNEMMRWMEAFEAGLECSGVEKMEETLYNAPALPEGWTKEPSPRIAETLLQWCAEYNDWRNKAQREVIPRNLQDHEHCKPHP